MNGLYTEHCIKRRTTAAMQFGKVLYAIAAVVLFVFGLLLSGNGAVGYLVSFLGIAMFISMFFLLPRLNVDFEYIFCDGQIDFDKIMGGEKRKQMLRIDMDNVEIMAPEKSHQLDSYRNQQDLTIKDFSSKDPEAKKYCIFTSNGKEKLYIIFEPSEKMVEFAKQKGPRKVFTD